MSHRSPDNIQSWILSEKLHAAVHSRTLQFKLSIYWFHKKVQDSSRKNYVHVKGLACNRRQLNSSLLLPSYADAHTQHNKKVDRHQNLQIIFFIKVVSDLKFGHFYFSWPHLTSATSEVRWKTSNFILDFDVEKKKILV